MAATSYSTLKTAIADWLDRDDVSTIADDWINFAEARIYRELRHSFMETALSATTSSGVASLPSDFLELKSAYLTTTPTTPLEIRNAQWVQDQYPTRAADGVPTYVAVDRDTLIFGPYPDSDYVVAGTYYAKPAALSTGNETNWLTTNAMDLLLYGSLVHSAPYIGHDQRVQLWERAYQDALARVQKDDDRKRIPWDMPIRQVAG